MEQHIKGILRQISERTPLRIYCAFVNFRLAMRGRKIRIAAQSDSLLMKVEDRESTIIICRRGRYKRYKRSISIGIAGLVKDYHLQNLHDLSGGLFIDCGANVGELGIWAKSQNMEYLAFEPEALEAHCCDLNNFASQTHTFRKALWKENTTLSFYSKADTADGSVYETDGSVRMDVEAVTLDAVLHGREKREPIILKLEAEGAEPEVLEGAKESLAIIDFVTVDCGPEKGFEQENTFVACHDILLENGFKLEIVGFRRVTALYRNIRKHRGMSRYMV